MFEEIAPKRSGVFRNILLIIVSGFVLLSLPSWIPGLFAIPYVTAIYELLVFFVIGLLILRFLRGYAVEYKYSLVGSTLLIRSKIGSKETILAEISLNEAATLVPLPEAADLIRQNRWDVRRISYGVSDKKAAYLLTFPSQNGHSALIFQPSQKFVEILKQKLLDKSEKM